MLRHFVVLSAYASSCLCLAWQFPFLSRPTPSPALTQETTTTVATDESTALRIAIIGAGAGGSSTAFWLRKAAERHGIPTSELEIDVYEKSVHVGGRSTTVYPYDDASYEPVELGASIFVDANRNIMRAVRDFNLSLLAFREGTDEDGMGIWDGERFVLTTGGGSWTSWLDNLRILWRYGYTSCTRAPKLVQNLVKSFLTLYTPARVSWNSIENISAQLGWTNITAQTAESYMLGEGIGPLFVHELLESISRVNYGQNADEIHALMGVVSMAADGAHSVQGGNFQVFEEFIARSGAKLRLNTTVTGLQKLNPSGKWLLSISPPTPTPIVSYDHVIIAAPFASSGVTILSSAASTTLLQPKVEYVHLHVTLLATSKREIGGEYFGFGKNGKAPKMILTTDEGRRKGGKGPEFNSLSYHGKVRRREGEESKEADEERYVAKIFSKEAVTDAWLNEVFGEGAIEWIHRAEFDAYPKGKPTTEFPPVNPDNGLWYVNAFEPFISTMETETLSGRNIANSLFEGQYGSGLCGPANSSVVADESEDASSEWGGTGAEGKIWGWDC